MPEIITAKIPQEKLKRHLSDYFTNMVKFVVDIRQEILALGAEMHADCESVLLDNGSKQQDLWGGNLYPFREPQKRIEYTSLINIRPSQDNRDMEVKDTKIRAVMQTVVEQLLLSPNERLS